MIRILCTIQSVINLRESYSTTEHILTRCFNILDMEIGYLRAPMSLGDHKAAVSI